MIQCDAELWCNHKRYKSCVGGCSGGKSSTDRERARGCEQSNVIITSGNSFKSNRMGHRVSSLLQYLSWNEFCFTDLDLFSLRDSPLQRRRKTERRLKMRLQITSLRSTSSHPSVNNLPSVFYIILRKVEACKFFPQVEVLGEKVEGVKKEVR